MSNIAELHILKERIKDLEETVEIIDRGQTKEVAKVRDRLAAGFAASGVSAEQVYTFADIALGHRINT